MSRRTRSAFGIAGVVLTALMLVACKKPPPPPLPPPPPPPPPPPAEISLESIAQDQKPDARVQFMPDLKVTEDKLDLGKAVVHFADAFAKGDSKALKPMLTNRARALLDDLVSSGGWDEATKPIEAVRVVFLHDGVDLGGVGAASPLAGEVTMRIMSKMMDALKGVPPEQLMAMQKAATQAMAGIDPSALASDPAKMAEVEAKLAEAAKAAGVSDETITKLSEIGKEMAADVPAPDAAAGGGGGGSGLGLLLAIQDPKGAYLLGWSAEKVGDNWLFTNAPATGDIRPRASLWDNIGPEGFQVVKIAAAPSAMPDDLTGAGPGGAGMPGAPGAPGPGGGAPDGSPPSSPGPGGTPPAPPGRAPGSPGRPPGSN